MNLCMCTCDNKFSNILKAVILLETTEVAWHAWHTHVHTCILPLAHTHTRYHLQAISQAIPSKEGLFLPLPAWLFLSKSDTALIISSLAYQLFGKRCNCSAEGKKAGGKEEVGVERREVGGGRKGAGGWGG